MDKKGNQTTMSPAEEKQRLLSETVYEERRFKKAAEVLLKQLNEMRRNRFRQIATECPDSDCLAKVLPAYQDLMHHTDKVLTAAHYELSKCYRQEKQAGKEKEAFATCFSWMNYILRYEMRRINLDGRPEKELLPPFVSNKIDLRNLQNLS